MMFVLCCGVHVATGAFFKLKPRCKFLFTGKFLLMILIIILVFLEIKGVDGMTHLLCKIYLLHRHRMS